MTRAELTANVLDAAPGPRDGRVPALIGAALGVAGIGAGFFLGDGRAGWVALLVATALAAGLGAFGVVLSAIFELTGARWGRAYRRLAEGSVALMPVALVGLLVLLAGAGRYLPWLHERFAGGRAVWLTRPFWDLRLLLALLALDGVCLAFLYYSLRRDFCLAEVRRRFTGRIAALVGSGIADPEATARRCSARLAVLAPAVAIVFALALSLVGFDLIMALEPTWFSTLFGAWYFVGHLFMGLALLAIVSVVLKADPRLGAWLTDVRQRDLGTLLFAFCLVNTDFFWSQYLTIWYGNLPEETPYIIKRTVDGAMPWGSLSWVTLAAIFVLPFVALLFRKVKDHRLLLGSVSSIVVAGIFLCRFLEIAPSILHLGRAGELARPLISAALVCLGFGGAGWLLYRRFLAAVPIMPVNDEIFVRELADPEER